jgi:hypothetical protein
MEHYKAPSPPLSPVKNVQTTNSIEELIDKLHEVRKVISNSPSITGNNNRAQELIHISAVNNSRGPRVMIKVTSTYMF